MRSRAYDDVRKNRKGAEQRLGWVKDNPRFYKDFKHNDAKIKEKESEIAELRADEDWRRDQLDRMVDEQKAAVDAGTAKGQWQE